ncbi:MAG: GNAT family N-acetyltransferase [Bacteroidales bacterium]|jgi:ribosomal protein S18 acetylase RimI-like enzyme|nr:GNAT family N-acetyltransferase [Bacteroidales bacterium]
MQTIKNLSCRLVETADFKAICNLPQSAEELFFMFPKAEYPLTESQLEIAVNNRFDSTVVLQNNVIVGFANFYEKEENNYCSIGNVIVSSKLRNQGVGAFLIQAMERIALTKYNVSEIHISCFNTNTKGILLYSKLGYTPYKIEKRMTSQGESLALIKLRKVLVL